MTLRDLTEEHFNAVVDTIYEASTDNTRWVAAIEAVGKASGGFGGSMALWDIQQSRPPTSYNQGFPPDFWAEYSQHLMHLDPLAPAFVARPELEMYTGEILLGVDGEMDKRRRHIKQQSGQSFAYGARLFADNGIESTLILARNARQGMAQASDLARLKLFLPHMRRSILIARKIGERTTFDALEALSFGIIVIAQSGEISFVNKAMERMGADGDGIALSAAGLTFMQPEDDARFKRLVDAVRRRKLGEPVTQRTAISITRRSGKRPYSVLVAPFPGMENLFPGTRQAVLVCVSDPANTAHLSEDIVMALFGLSRSEAKMSIALVHYGSLSAAALECGLTEGSARQYIKRILFKTGAQGQVDLVALLMGSLRL